MNQFHKVVITNYLEKFLQFLTLPGKVTEQVTNVNSLKN